MYPSVRPADCFHAWMSVYSCVRPADCFRLNNNLLVHDEIDAECRDLACRLLGLGCRELSQIQTVSPSLVTQTLRTYQ